MDQQRQENKDPAAVGRMSKSRPWQSDMADSGHGKPHSLGPAPSPSSGSTRSRWAAPWRSKGGADYEPPALTDDDISLGESVGEESLPEQKKAPPPPPPPPPIVQKPPTPAPSLAKPVPVKADNSKKNVKEASSATATKAPASAKAKEIAEENAELLAIDFDRDGEALRQAIAEDVLAMWEEQGLYNDMPDLRNELLKGIVDQKFQALRDEQAKVLEQKQLAGMPKLAAEQPSLRMSIITEEEEEEEEETSDEEDGTKTPVSEVQEANITKEERIALNAVRVQREAPVPEVDEANLTEEERIALNAVRTQLELQSKLKTMDTSDHVYVEALGRLGNLTEKEQMVSIKDVHAFNKFKLHDAVEKRVSKIFTDDHHVVSSGDQEDKEKEMDGSSESVPVVFPSEEKETSMRKVRETLSTSFSAFDALLSKKPSQEELEEHDDEWTECEETVVEVVEPAEIKPEDIKKLVADMDRKLGLIPGVTADDDDSFMEYTVRDEIEEYTVKDDYTVDVDELSDKRERARTPTAEVDIDELSAQRHQERAEREQAEKEKEKEKPPIQSIPRIIRPQGKRPIARLASTESSYIEMTVTDETFLRDNSRRDLFKKESEKDKQQFFHKQASMTSLSGKFPTITMTTLDDDELTQITFDQTLGEANSTTQDHHLADAYLNKSMEKPKALSPSPRKCMGSASQQTDPTRETVPMDEASFSQHERGSVGDSSSRDSSTALAKSVAKILRVEIWSPKAKVVQSGMEKLANAAGQGFCQRSNIARLGGVIAILRAMQSHPTHLQIQRSGCEALAHLSIDEDTQEAISEVGGTGAIVQAMESHPSDQQLQESACVALAYITSPRGGVSGGTGMSDSDEEEETASSGTGVVKALVTAMNNNSQNAEIQAKAFGALANLCLDNQGRLQELSQTGGLTSMTMALQKPWANKMEQHEAISTLSILLRSLAEFGTSC